MNKHAIHIPDCLFLQALDGELDVATSKEIRDHVEACWSCRARQDQMGRTISRIVSWRNKELGSYPGPSIGGQQRLVADLIRQSAEAERAPLWRSVFRLSGVLTPVRFLVESLGRYRAPSLSAAVALLTIVLLLILPIANPPIVTADVLLDKATRARAVELSSSRKRVYQRIEIRSGQRVLQRELILGGERFAKRTARENIGWAPPGLAEIPLAWDDPLGVSAFEHWRDHLNRKVDRVVRKNNSATLVTTSGGVIMLASVTMRETDWHPIAKRIEFRGWPSLEVRELSFEIRDAPAASAAIASSADRRSPATAANFTPEPSPPTSQQLDEAEIRLREVLHSLGADKNAVYEIWRDSASVRFHAADPEAMSQVTPALREIPYVDPNASPGGVRSAVEGLPSMEQQAVYNTQPPLANRLQEYLGGIEAANNYMAMLRDLHRKAFSAATALKQLGERYPPVECERLSPGLRDRLENIAARDAIESSGATQDYLAAMSLVSNEMLREYGEAVAAEADLPQRGTMDCEPWQSVSGSFASDLLELQESFRRLFQEDQSDRPVVVTASSLLKETTQARTRVEGDLRRLCPPDQHRR